MLRINENLGKETTLEKNIICFFIWYYYKYIACYFNCEHCNVNIGFMFNLKTQIDALQRIVNTTYMPRQSSIKHVNIINNNIKFDSINF